MDQPKYSTLTAALQTVPDPRKARGQRHNWRLILSLIAAGLVSGQRNGRAIGQWVREHAAELTEYLAPEASCLPSLATLERAWRAVESRPWNGAWPTTSATWRAERSRWLRPVVATCRSRPWMAKRCVARATDARPPSW